MAGQPNIPPALKHRLQQAIENPEQATNSEPATPTASVPQGTDSQTNNPQAATGSAPPGAGDRVSLSRSELDQLRADAQRASQASLQAERMRDQLEALQARLTEAPTPAKDESNAQQPAASQQRTTALSYETEAPPVTDQERKDFGDSEEYVTKVAKSVVAAELRALVPKIDSMIQDVLARTNSTSERVEKTQRNAFKSQVEQGLAKPLDAFIHTEDWKKFIEAYDDGSGFTYQQILASHLERGNAEHARKVYRKFLDQSGTEQNSSNQGYAGANPTGASADTPSETQEAGKLKYSDHKKAHNQYIKREISWGDYQAIQREFDKAEKESRIDYNS